MKHFRCLTLIIVLLIALGGAGCDSNGQLMDDMATVEGVFLLRDEAVLSLFQLDADGEPSDVDALMLVIAD